MSDTGETGKSPPKRIRLSLACNQCRKRKVRCDTQTPKCRNCLVRDEICETTDPRRPDSGPNVRRLAINSNNGLSPGHDRAKAVVPFNRRWSWSVSTATRTEGSASVPADSTTSDDSSPAVTMSWMSRGYQNSINTAGGGAEDNTHHPDDPDLVVNTENGSYRFKYLGASSLQCLAIFVDIYLRRKGLQTICPSFLNGMRHAEEFPLPLSTPIPPLPPLESVRGHLDTFFTKIWPLYPAVDRLDVEADVRHFKDSERSHINLTPRDVPQLVSIFSIIAIAADESYGAPSKVGETYLTAAHSLLAHLVAAPYLPSVQALFLLALAQQARCKDGQGWHILGQAIRIAHSIGLHRHMRPPPASADTPSGGVDLPLRGRVWWSCYALEKLMEIEAGRPTAINDEDIDSPLPQRGSVCSMEEELDYFAIWVALARILSQISKHLYRQKPCTTSELICGIGGLDQQLLEWLNVMPDSIKPGHEVFTSYDPTQQRLDRQHLSSFLSIQFWQAQIILFRAALVFPTQTFAEEVRRQGSKLPSYLRLLQSENICTGVARAILRQVLELADHDIHSHILSATPPFLATIVLALHILKNPSKRMVRSDLELLITATEYLEAHYRRAGQNPNFIRGCETLRTSVLAAVAVEQHHQQSGSSIHSTSPIETRTGMDMIDSTDAASSLVPDQVLQVPDLASDLAFFGTDGDVPLAELWGAIGSYSFPLGALDDQSLQ